MCEDAHAQAELEQDEHLGLKSYMNSFVFF